MIDGIAAVLRRLALTLLTLAATAAPAAAADAVYTLAIIPSAPPVTMNTLWSPVVERLARSTGLQFRLKHYERMADFERDIASGAPDFIFTMPTQLAVAHATSGYIPLVRSRNPVAVGLFVREDSPLRSVDDLMGKKISFVGNKNVCHVAIHNLLSKRAGKLMFERDYAGSTRNVIINVLLGKTDAGAIFLPELERESTDTRARLRQLVQTPDFASHPLSAHPRVAAKVRKAVTRAVVAMAATPRGDELLQAVRLGHAVPADYARDYAALDEMDVKGPSNWGQ